MDFIESLLRPSPVEFRNGACGQRFQQVRRNDGGRGRERALAPLAANPYLRANS
jgi:hypothetical protein